MHTGLIILAAILAVLVIILNIPAKLYAEYENDEIDKKASVFVKYGFIKYSLYPKKEKKEKKDKKEKEEKEEFSFEKKKEEVERYIRIFNAIKEKTIELLSYLTRRAVVFDNITVKSEFGFDDAMQTGIFTGIYNGFVYSVMGIIHHNSNLRDMEVNLQPVFGKKCFNNHFSCILKIKTAHIIVVAFYLVIIFIKIKKEGRK